MFGLTLDLPYRRSNSWQTIQDVRKEITTQIEKLIPTKYCKSSEKVCPAGPPDILVSLVRRDHVEEGHQRERKVFKVPWHHWKIWKIRNDGSYTIKRRKERQGRDLAKRYAGSYWSTWKNG